MAMRAEDGMPEAGASGKEGAMRPGHVGRMLSRGLRLRCPLCGRGALFRGMFRMHRVCRVCGLWFEREAGYFIGGMELHWILTYVLGVAGYFPARPFLPAGDILPVLIYLVAAFALSLLLYRPARGLWMALDNICDPVERELTPPEDAFAAPEGRSQVAGDDRRLTIND